MKRKEIVSWAIYWVGIAFIFGCIAVALSSCKLLRTDTYVEVTTCDLKVETAYDTGFIDGVDFTKPVEYKRGLVDGYAKGYRDGQEDWRPPVTPPARKRVRKPEPRTTIDLTSDDPLEGI
jgi:hypothetical protein